MNTIWRNWFRSGKEQPRDSILGSVSAAELRNWMLAGDTMLVDIREAEEHERRSIPGAVSVPLSRYPSTLSPGEGKTRVVFHCQSGNRTHAAAARLAASSALPVYALADGLNGWQQLSSRIGTRAL